MSGRNVALGEVQFVVCTLENPTLWGCCRPVGRNYHVDLSFLYESMMLTREQSAPVLRLHTS